MPSICSLPMRQLGQLLFMVDRFIPAKVLPIQGHYQFKGHATSLDALIWSLTLPPTDPTWGKNRDRLQSKGNRGQCTRKNKIVAFSYPLFQISSPATLGCQPESTGNQPEQCTRLSEPTPVFSWPPPASLRGLIRRENCLYITSILQDSGPFEPSKYDFFFPLGF